MAKNDNSKNDDAPRRRRAKPRDVPVPQPLPDFDPFATFAEWASEEDTAGYANL